MNQGGGFIVPGEAPQTTIDFNEACIVLRPSIDNVAVCKMDLKAGVRIILKNDDILIKNLISKGQRFAINKIMKGETVVQYGYPFGISAGIKKGELIHSGNIRPIQDDLEGNFITEPPKTIYDERYLTKTFKGYKRANGQVGTRCYYLIVPTSQCASQIAVQTASLAQEKYNISVSYPNIDGFVAIPNTEGCGCASGLQINRFLRILNNFITHPNVGGVLIIDLGCEQTNYTALFSYVKNDSTSLVVPTDWLTIQEVGGTQKTIEKALNIIGQRLPEINNASRCECPIQHLLIGTECGASDSFSGITANPVIGNAVDKVIYGKGSAILSEVPEMIGAEKILMRRMRNHEIVLKFKKMMRWYRALAEKLNVDMSDNLVPENIKGGLVNSCIKSIGAIAKGGTTAIEDVVHYGERISKRGLNIMQGPGNDIESVTGIVASSANIICFSTGKGTVTGTAIVPAIKISSTTELFQKMPDDIDFDAGGLLSTLRSLSDFGDALLDLIISVASGKKTKSEINGQRQFQVWTAGKLSL